MVGQRLMLPMGILAAIGLGLGSSTARGHGGGGHGGGVGHSLAAGSFHGGFGPGGFGHGFGPGFRGWYGYGYPGWYGLGGLGLGLGLGYGLGYGYGGYGYGGYGYGGYPYPVPAPYPVYVTPGYGGAPGAYGAACPPGGQAPPPGTPGAPPPGGVPPGGPPPGGMPPGGPYGGPLRLTDSDVLLTIRVPPEAIVSINGERTTQYGPRREFMSSGLSPGRSYTFVVTARWGPKGQEVEQERRLTVQGGERRNVDFLTVIAPPQPELLHPPIENTSSR